MRLLCLKCKKEIKNPQALFCYFCGAVLEPVSAEVPENTESPSNPKAKVKVKALAPVFVGVFALALIGVYTTIIVPLRSAPSKTLTISEINPSQEEILEKEEIKVSGFVDSISFGKERYELIVPSTAYFYSESHILSKPFKDDIALEFTKALEGALDLKKEEAFSYFKDSMSLFCTKEGCGILLSIKGESFPKKVDSYKPAKDSFKVFQFGNYLLLYKEDELKKEVGEVFEKLSKNLGMSSKFIESFKILPSKGPFFLYLGSKEDFSNSFSKEDLFNINFVSDKFIKSSKLLLYIEKQQDKEFIFY